jgi:hypothetical protein
MPERDGARADAGSYADKRARMRPAEGFLIRGSHVTVRIWRADPWLPRRQCSAVNAIGAIRDAEDSVKDCGLPHASHAAGRTSHLREKGTAPSTSLAKAAASIAVDVGRTLISRDDADASAWISAMPSFSCPSGQPQPSEPGMPLGSRSRD